MIQAIVFPLVALGAVLAIFTAYELTLMAASLPALWRRRRPEMPGRPVTRYAIVIPAHNEAALIGNTVRSVLESDYPGGLRHVVVIADNCTDETANEARRAGAECRERVDPERRGKPHALHWIFEQIDLTGFGGVVIIDADTIVERGFLRAMDARLQRGERAIQGYYGVMNPDDNWLTRLGVLPATLNNYLTFPGKRALGLSCPLAGNGMCFEAGIIRRLGWNAFTLSEDWEYYLILALDGCVVTSAPEAMIYGQVANSLKLGRAQRMRWMKGRMDALAIHWRPLLRKGLSERDLVSLDAMFDIARPTHSILFFWSVLFVVICTALALLTGGHYGLLAFAVAILAGQIGYFLAGFAVERPPLRTWLALAMVPWYLLWKVGVTMRALFNLRERSWVRTPRN